MARKRYTAEEIVGHLRTIGIEIGKGLTVVDACRKLGITEQTYGTNCSTANFSTRCTRGRRSVAPTLQ
jgi:putative transposase